MYLATPGGAPATWHPDEVTRGAARMVRTADLNPHAFPYGGLHYYVVASFAVAPVAVLTRIASAAGWIDATDEAFPDWTLKWTMVAARTISALMTTATVAMTIEIGARLFSPAAGLAGGALLLAAPGSVVIAHYASVDAAANFWFWLACFGTLNIWKTGSRGSYLLSGVAAGFAIGTKIDRSLVLLPLIAGHLLRGRAGRHRDLLAAIGVAAIAFLASNPFVVTAPFEFLDGFTRDLMFNAFMTPTEAPIREFATSLRSSLGTPLLFLLATGCALGIVLLLRGRKYPELFWVTATFLPMAAVYSVATSMDRYVTILFPALALLAGYAAVKVLSTGPISRRALAALPLAAALAWSLVICAAVDRVLMRDPRYAATEWLDRHAPRRHQDRHGSPRSLAPTRPISRLAVGAGSRGSGRRCSGSRTAAAMRIVPTAPRGDFRGRAQDRIDFRPTSGAPAVPSVVRHRGRAHRVGTDAAGRSAGRRLRGVAATPKTRHGETARRGWIELRTRGRISRAASARHQDAIYLDRTAGSDLRPKSSLAVRSWRQRGGTVAQRAGLRIAQSL